MNDAINKSLVFGSQIVTVILVVCGAALQQSELRSSRPPGQGTNQTHDAESGDRYARLWEDPLSGLEAFNPKPESKSASAGGEAPAQTSTNIPPPASYRDKKEPTLVLWQVIDSRPTPEATEWRRRARYATGTALAAAGYEPSFDSSLRAIKTPPGWRRHDPNVIDTGDDDTDSPEKPADGKPGLIAYFERFRLRESGDNKRLPTTVSVVWYPEQIKVSHGSEKPHRLDRHERVSRFLIHLDAPRTHGKVTGPDPSAPWLGFLSADEKTTICVLHHGDSVKLRRYLNTPTAGNTPEGRLTGRDFFVRATLPAIYVGAGSHEPDMRLDGFSQYGRHRKFKQLQQLQELESLGESGKLDELRALADEGKSGDHGLSETLEGIDRSDLLKKIGSYKMFMMSESHEWCEVIELLVSLERVGDFMNLGLCMPPAVRDLLDQFKEHKLLDKFESLGKSEKLEILEMIGLIETIKTIEKIAGLRKVQAAMPDDRIFRQLTRELLLRLPALHSGGEKPRIVIVTESDGTYGHNLRKLAEKKEYLGSHADIIVYSYLRGLDGLSSETTTAHDKSGSAEQSWGTSQYDYLSRLASSLKRECDKGKPVAAIGVLGSDVYDKLLVLQAFHRELPTPIYFTTDLDSVYLGREQLPFTRNLIIVSGEDLLLPTADAKEMGAGKWNFPPMRDTYQTVLIRTIFNILNPGTIITATEAGTWDRAVDQAMEKARDKPARVWEIGSGMAIEFDPGKPSWMENLLFKFLSVGASNLLVFLTGFFNALLIFAAFLSCSSAVAGRDEAGLRLSHLVRNIPDLEVVFAGIFIFLLGGLIASALVPVPNQVSIAGIVVAVLAMATGFLRWRSPANLQSFKPWKDPVMQVCAMIFLTAGLLPILVISSGDSNLLWGETLNPFAGLGIWPSILIRTLAFLVGLLLLRYTFEGFHQEWQGVREGLRGFENSAIAPPVSTVDWWDLTSGAMIPVPKFLRRFLNPHEDEPAGDSSPGRTFKDDLEECEDPLRVFRRVLVLSFIYLIASMLLFWIWPSSIPARGALPFLAEKLTLSFGVGLYIIHLCFCFELHGSAFRLINRLADIVETDPGDGPVERYHDAARQVERLTRVVGNTLLYPLTILTLLLLSRLRLFDDWNMMPSLLITFLLGVVILASASVLLLRAGRRFRRNTEVVLDARLRQLKRDLESAREAAAKNPEDKAASRADANILIWKEQIEKVGSIREGAFAPWFLQPIFIALFAAIAVFGTTSFMEPLLTMFME